MIRKYLKDVYAEYIFVVTGNLSRVQLLLPRERQQSPAKISRCVDGWKDKLLLLLFILLALSTINAVVYSLSLLDSCHLQPCRST